MERIPMTREGYEKKKAELEKLNRYMLEVTQRVATAREMGDLSENAEYHAAREEQGLTDAKINQLKDQIARAEIVDPSLLPKGTVVFGARVKVRDVESEEEEEFTLVGPGDDDPDENRILTTSPIGQGLLGRKIGDRAEIEVPRGTIKFEILAIEFDSI